MVIKFRAKVKMISEQNLELDHMDIDFKDTTWVWTDVAILTEQIEQLTKYSKTKTLILLGDGTKMLAQEDFDSLFATWEASEKDEKAPEEEETEENNEESEDISDEEGD